MNDGEPHDVSIVESEAVYGKKDQLVETVSQFLDSLSERKYLAHAIGPAKRH